MKDWKKLLLEYKYIFIFIGFVLLFFYQFFISGRIPIPADTIIGLFHPFRDVVWDGLASGVPVKNPLITDPVRQQYIWRYLGIESLKNSTLPLWNPYSFSGTPLLANFQSAPLYPLNILFFVLAFPLAWSILIILEPLLAGLFLYLYLQHMKIGKLASFLGAFVFAFSGFSIAWMTWNTITHTVLWLPLILLAKEHLLRKTSFRWIVVLIFSEVSQIFGGHLQLLFYSIILSNIYLIIRIIQLSFISRSVSLNITRAIRKYIPFIVIGIIIISITAIQWVPTLQFINLSARNFDQGSWMKPGWFIPWQNLIQFIAPDFFGNPTTNNYWGVWNYGEFIGYIGIIPLVLSIYALFFRKDKKTLFFGTLVFLALLFAFPTPIAKLPFEWGIPLLSTSQPTRLMFVIDFCLSILAALGFDQFLREKSIKKTIAVFAPIIFLELILFLIVNQTSVLSLSLPIEYIRVAQRNLLLPISLSVSAFLLFLFSMNYKKNMHRWIIYFIVLVMIGDLFRFGWKFTPFSKSEWIFPMVRLLDKIAKDKGYYRFMTTDRRIMPPNFSDYYHIADVSGYDPLYLKKYAELVAAWGRGKPDISPAAFNRILTPEDYTSPIADLLGVKYILSFQEEKSPKLKPIDSQGMTKLYENRDVYPRVFLVNQVIKAVSNQDEIDKLFDHLDELNQVAISQSTITLDDKPLESGEEAKIILYEANKIQINTITNATRLLILTDIYYPTWKVYIDTKPQNLYAVDYVLRGVVVPKGVHQIEMRDYLL